MLELWSVELTLTPSHTSGDNKAIGDREPGSSRGVKGVGRGSGGG